jgi:menaquinone-specific isochorismate synthase
MTVTPYCQNLFQNHQDLFQVLFDCQQESLRKNHPQIISISLKIDAVDPLAIFQQLADSDQLNCYFEKQNSHQNAFLEQDGIAIAAMGAAVQQAIKTSNQFLETQTFIQATLANTVIIKDWQTPYAGPHFFCSFTFFERRSQPVLGLPTATVFLPAWQVSKHLNGCTVVANLVVDKATNITVTTNHLFQKLNRIRTIKPSFLDVTTAIQTGYQRENMISPNHFKQVVASALQRIQAQTFDKIVLAHAIEVRLPQSFHLIHSLHHLRTVYPDCYIFAIGQGSQQFIGASPERLVALQNHQLLTDALAGSAPRGQTAWEDASLANGLLHSTKELYEHQIVTQFIAGQLAQFGLEPCLSPLRLRQLSNIQHLQTPISAVVPSQVHLLDLVAALHPTPAVAGMPRKVACEYIRRYEPIDRGLYAAPIGWVDHQGNGEFAVGIRSALIEGCTARLFAGAGIVAGSNPDRELAEVELKLQALLAALV